MQATNRIPLFRSISFKIVCIILVLNTLILGGFTAYNIQTATHAMQSELHKLAEVTATRLAKHVMIPLWDLDKEQIDEMLNSEMLEKHLAAILVRDSDGKTVFAGKERNATWQAQNARTSGVSNTTGFIQQKQRILKGTEKIGEVEVYLTPKFMQAALQQETGQRVLSVLVVDVALFIVVLLALRRLVIRPIGQLAAAADGISLGNLDVSIGIQTQDEIGRVADAMERMKISLRLAMQRLQQTR